MWFVTDRIQTHYVGDGCDPPHAHFPGDGCERGDVNWAVHEADVGTYSDPPAEPLRVPDQEDSGEPMPAEARERQEQFDRDAEAAHERLDGQTNEETGKTVLCKLYLPLPMRTTAQILQLLGRDFPGASMENPDGDPEVIQIVVPKETGQ